MWHIVTMFWFSVHVFCWLITCALSIFSVLDNFCQIAPLHSNAVWMTRVLHLIWNAHTHILLFGGKFHKQCMCKCSIYKSKNQKYREKKIKNIEKIGYFRNCTHHHPCLLAASICRVVNDTFFSLFKYKIQNTLENMYLKYLYQILLNWFWKYKILFSKCISNTKYMRTGNCLFLSTVENVITDVVVHNVKQSSEHTTQSLQFCYKPVKHIRHSGREAASLAVTAYKLIFSSLMHFSLMNFLVVMVVFDNWHVF